MALGTGGNEERRRYPRYAVDLPAHVTIGGKRVPCRLANVSSGGALIAAVPLVKVGSKVDLDMPGIGTVSATVVRLTETHIGLMFPGVVVITPLLHRSA